MPCSAWFIRQAASVRRCAAGFELSFAPAAPSPLSGDHPPLGSHILKHCGEREEDRQLRPK